MPERIVLTDISSAAWEHPADRAALNALRAIPGLETHLTLPAGSWPATAEASEAPDGRHPWTR